MIIGNIIVGITFKIYSKKYIADDPKLKDGYDKLIKGWFIIGNIPWVIMTIGDFTGLTNGMQEYFDPKSMNPMVLVLHFYTVVLLVLGSRWIYLKDGADFLAKHPGLIRGLGGDITSPKTIKIIWTIVLVAGIASMTEMWLGYITMPG